MICIDFKITNRKPVHAGVVVGRYEDANLLLEAVYVHDGLEKAHTYKAKEAKMDLRTFLKNQTTDDGQNRMTYTLEQDLMELGGLSFVEAYQVVSMIKDKLEQYLDTGGVNGLQGGNFHYIYIDGSFASGLHNRISVGVEDLVA